MVISDNNCPDCKYGHFKKDQLRLLARGTGKTFPGCIFISWQKPQDWKDEDLSGSISSKRSLLNVQLEPYG